MGESVFTDAAIEVVPESSLLSEPVTIKDIHIPTATVHTLSFSAPFSLVSTSARRTKVRAFVLYFDTFFPDTPDPVKEEEEVQITRAGEARLAEVWSPRRRVSTGFVSEPTSSPEIVAEATSPMDVKPPLPRKPSLKRPKSEAQDPVPPPLSPRLRRQSQGPIKPEPMTSFSTGPRSVPTHWKQTIFLLREPVDVREGDIVFAL
jgi:protein arginine N-methyltransferase 3